MLQPIGWHPRRISYSLLLVQQRLRRLTAEDADGAENDGGTVGNYSAVPQFPQFMGPEFPAPHAGTWALRNSRRIRRPWRLKSAHCSAALTSSSGTARSKNAELE